MKNTFSRWLPAIARTPARKAVLTAAGVAFISAGIVGPTTAAFANTTPSTPATSATMSASVPAAAVTPVPTPPGTKVLSYDYKLQPNFYYCGPAATRIALSAIGKTPSMDDIAKKLGTTTDGTNSAVDVTRVLNSVSGDNFYKTHEIRGAKATGPEMDQLRMDIVRAVSSDHVVVANISGAVTDNSGNAHSYEGHYLTVVGYTDGGMTVKIADPADTKGDGSYFLPVAKLANWIATKGYAA